VPILKLSWRVCACAWPWFGGGAMTSITRPHRVAAYFRTRIHGAVALTVTPILLNRYVCKIGHLPKLSYQYQTCTKNDGTNLRIFTKMFSLFSTKHSQHSSNFIAEGPTLLPLPENYFCEKRIEYGIM
jgi:hypothetical protein